ncbi:MAG: glycosyltransferase family 2 protein [Streptomycetales bacterium]
MTGLVVAVCTSRLDDLEARWEHNIAQVESGEFFVLLDMPESVESLEVAGRIRSRGGEVICHGAMRGLSAARNSVLDARPKGWVLFIDDDVRLDRKAVDAVRAAFAAGAEVVGARLVPPDRPKLWPWFFTRGQMHLVGWHSPEGEVKTWGACMGIDAAFAHRHGLRFDMRLGRTGQQLESGDDTSFVTAMKAAGARELVLPHVSVVHEVNPRRLTLRYLVRRAYWQGRSEVRREQPAAGLRKEWRRYCAGRRINVLALGYVTVVVVGIIREWFRPTRRSQHDVGRTDESARGTAA